MLRQSGQVFLPLVAAQSILPHHRKRHRSSIASPFGAAPAEGTAHDLPNPGRPGTSLDLAAANSSGMQLLSTAAELDSDPTTRIEIEGRLSQQAGSPRDTPNNSSEHHQVALS